MCAGIAGLDCQCAVVLCDGVVQPARLLQPVAQILARRYQSRLELGRSLKGRQGLAEVATCEKDRSEIVVDFGKPRLQFCGLPQEIHGIAAAELSGQHAEEVEAVEMMPIECDDLAVETLRL